MAEYTGKTVLVTGGAQGIGRGITEYLLARSNTVIIADCDQAAGEELLERFKPTGRLHFFLTDVSEEDSVRDCFARLTRDFGVLDGLVNNAGIANPGSTPVTELALTDWNRMLGTNLTGSFLMVKHGAALLAGNRGAVVNIASTRALQSEANTEAYAASKGGLVALTHALAVSFGRTIRVNGVLPGWIDVSRHQKQSACYDAGLSARDHDQHPAGRVGKPEDIAALTVFLLSAEAGFITGQCFVADGGMTRKMIYEH